MPTKRRVFFSFHYQGDSWRIGQVRNSWVTKTGSAGAFIDAAEWEAVEGKGSDSVERWIDRQLKGTSVTVVLIGAKTSKRRFVKYEIEQSIAKGNGLLGVCIHNVRDRLGAISEKGRNPLDDHLVRSTGFQSLLFDQVRASTRFHTYDWVHDRGYEKIEDWIEEAAAEAATAPLACAKS